MRSPPQRGRKLATGAALLAFTTLAAASPATQLPRRGRLPGRTLDDTPWPQQQQRAQRFDATVSRVRVDVIVTDADGNFVPDLTAGDFVVYEDGEPQEVLDVQLVDLAAGEVRSLLGDDDAVPVSSDGPIASRRSSAGSTRGAAGSATPRPRDSRGSPAAGADPSSAGGGAANDVGAPAPSAVNELGAVIFLIDGPGLSVQARARFGDAWTQLLAETGGLQVPRGAYMVDNAGRLVELAPLGYDAAALRAAADAVRAAPFFGDTTRQRLIEIANDLNDPNLGDDMERVAAAKARSYEGQERSRSLATYELLTTFADALWTRSGRTAVVWVSTGIKLMQGGPYATLLNTGADRPLFDAFSPDPSIHAAQEALYRAANGSNVSLYTVDPSLLAGSRLVGGDIEVREWRASSQLSTPELQQSIDGLRDALRNAAAETGGESFIHATDLRTVLEEIETDTSHFYLLTYAPPAPEGDGAYHEIRVNVLRDGTDVRARGGYVDRAPEDRARRLIAAALALPGSVTDLPVGAEAFASRPAPGAPNLLMAVAVDGADVGVALTPEGERQVSLDIHAVALRDGDAVDESHEQLSARAAAGDTGPGNDSALSATPVGYFAYEHEWSLPAGSYTLNVAVFDNLTGRVGATSIEVEIPDGESDDWGVSDPLLVSLDDAGRVQPVVLGRVLPGQNIATFVEVYAGQHPILSGEVLLEEGDGNPEQGTNLFPMALRHVAAGVHRGSVPLPTGMPPGHYVVQLVVTDFPAGEHKVVRLPLEVVALPAR